MASIVCDSTIYISEAELKALNLCIVPISYSIGGNSYYESCSDRNGDYEAMLLNTNEGISTSQTPVSTFAAAFGKLCARGQEVLCITLSSRLSGTFSSAVAAARDFKERVTVFDSRLTAGGLYLLVKRARALMDRGFAVKETVKLLERLREKIGVCFSVENMAPLRRSGRLGTVKQSAEAVLNIRPLFVLEEGAVVSSGKTRGRAEQLRSLISKIPQNPSEIVVMHLGRPSEASELYSMLKVKFPNAAITLSRIGPVLAVHLGTKIIGLSWICD